MIAKRRTGTSPLHQKVSESGSEISRAESSDESKGSLRWSTLRRIVAAPNNNKNMAVFVLAVSLVVIAVGAVTYHQDMGSQKKGTFLRQTPSLSARYSKNHLQEQGTKTCSIWMAPSSLKGHAGFGIYTTRDIAQDEAILAGPDGPSIAVVDTERGPVLRKERKIWHKTFDEYWWGRGVPDHVFYEGDSVVDYQITFGSLPNHNCMLGAIDHRYPAVPYNDALLDRFTDPGAGAVSYATGREFFVDRDIEAGEELFLNYGHCTREEDRDPNASHGWVTSIPMPEDFREAARLVRYQWNKVQQQGGDDTALDWSDASNDFVKSLLPTDVAQLRSLMDSLASQADLAKHIARYMATNARTVDWIKENGMCLEHIIPGPSYMPHAGQGAIAQHRIAKGDMVVPSPMLHIVDRKVLLIYDEDQVVTGEQLLVNYCLGHAETPLLLCPNTNAILINHCSKRKPFVKICPKGPNAIFRWSSGWESDSKKWQSMTVDEISQQKGRGLTMEVVALRTIEAGEEIFVDYGMDWEEAWFEHVRNWKPPKKTAKPWITAKEANEQKAILPSFIAGYLRKTTDHPYLFTGCVYWTTDWEDHEVFASPKKRWRSLSDKELLETYADDGMEFEDKYQTHGDQTHWPCSVLKANKDGTYTVRIHQSQWHDTTPWEENDVPRFLVNFPRQSIHFFVKPYHGDNHLKSAFRHPIGIPENIMPEQWKTL